MPLYYKVIHTRPTCPSLQSFPHSRNAPAGSYHQPLVHRHLEVSPRSLARRTSLLRLLLLEEGQAIWVLAKVLAAVEAARLTIERVPLDLHNLLGDCLVERGMDRLSDLVLVVILLKVARIDIGG